MAIQQDYSFQGTLVPDAYHRIGQVNVPVRSLAGDITIDVFSSKAWVDGGGERLNSIVITLSPVEVYALSGKTPPEGVEVPQIEASNPLEWCYKWLMLKDTFKDGTLV